MNTTAVKTHHIALGSHLYSLVQSAGSLFTKISAPASVWIARSQDSHQLSQMSARMLSDIGLNHYDVAREVNKFFWQK